MIYLLIDSCFDNGRREEGLCLWAEVKFCSVQVRPLVMRCQKRTFTEKQEDAFYHHGRSLYTVVMRATMWAWIDIYGNWHEAFMGILWFFPPQYCSSLSQCLTSTGKGCRPLSSLHRCVLLLQLFLVLRAGREWVCAGIFLAEVTRLSSVYVMLMRTNHRRKQMMSVYMHLYRRATPTEECACANISSTAPHNPPQWYRILN